MTITMLANLLWFADHDFEEDLATRTIKIISTILAVGVMVISSVSAQSFAKVGIVGAQFLKIEVGAQSAAMGSAAMAVVNDANAMFWNPSGLTSVQSQSAMVSQVNWLAGMSHLSAAAAMRLPGIGVMGVFMSYLSSGSIDVTTVNDQNGTGDSFEYKDMTFGIAWARNLTHKFAFGGNIKYVIEDFGFTDDISGEEIKAAAIAFDIGTQYITGFRSLRMGLAIQHFGPELDPAGSYADIIGFDAETQSPLRDREKDFVAYPMPMTFRAGIAMEVIELENQTLTLAADVLHPSDNVERMNFGAQYVFMDRLALRGGYIVNADAQSFTLGAGFKFGSASFDYAYLDYGILSNVQTLSISFNR